VCFSIFYPLSLLRQHVTRSSLGVAPRISTTLSAARICTRSFIFPTTDLNIDPEEEALQNASAGPDAEPEDSSLNPFSIYSVGAGERALCTAVVAYVALGAAAQLHSRATCSLRQQRPGICPLATLLPRPAWPI